MMTWVCHLAWWTNIMLKCVYPVIILISPSSSSTWWWDKYWQSGCEGPSMKRWTSVLLLAFLLTCGSCQRLHSSKLSMIQVLAQSGFKTVLAVTSGKSGNGYHWGPACLLSLGRRGFPHGDKKVMSDSVVPSITSHHPREKQAGFPNASQRSQEPHVPSSPCEGRYLSCLKGRRQAAGSFLNPSHMHNLRTRPLWSLGWEGELTQLG